ncbi:hypothetical protein, partial [Acetobacter aceti]|uniref:hypothetical protein n=1 Tax=Acetobacter aceti TaxID=435 RepID=UPI0019D7097F
NLLKTYHSEFPKGLLEINPNHNSSGTEKLNLNTTILGIYKKLTNYLISSETDINFRRIIFVYSLS